MATFELLLLLLAAVLLSSVLDQLIPKVSLPLVQIALGILIALLAVSPIEISINPDLFLVLFIAPLLFYEARRIDKAAFLKNRRPVVALAIGLVLLACLVIGFYVNWLIPSIPLAAAFALGAALGPTDAVAVASLSKEANISHKQKNVLEGESLINDASGIVTFQFAIAAAVTGAFSLLDASITFIISFFGGIIAGIILGYVAGFVIRKIRSLGLDNTTFHVLFEICTPFLIYLAAHALGVSGILAVVAAGLLNVLSPRTMGPAESRLNIVSGSVWQVLTFTLNGVVFVLLGAQLPHAMERSWESGVISNVGLIGYVLIITLMLAFIRFIWVFGMRVAEVRKEKPRHQFNKEDIRHCLIMTFSGARGAITLSLVLTIPPLTAVGNAFPQRSLIIFLASGVIICTLILATFVVPLLAPPKKDEEEEATRELESAVLIDIFRHVIEELSARQTPENRQATQLVIRSYNERITRAKETHDIEVEPNKELRIKALRWEQDCTIKLIDNEECDPVIGYQHINRLAQIQNLLTHKNKNAWVFQNAFRHFRLIARATLHSLMARFPGSVKNAESTIALRELQIKCSEFVITKLNEEISNPEAPTEDVSNLLYEYQRTLSTLKNARITVSTITRNAVEKADVERLGLSIELEQIQAMYEEGSLSRSSVKRLRENVHLMQIDIEEHI